MANLLFADYEQEETTLIITLRSEENGAPRALQTDRLGGTEITTQGANLCSSRVRDNVDRRAEN